MRTISTFFYVIGQGIKSTFKNKMFTLASIATIGACLFLFGIGYSVVLNVQHMVKTAEEGVSITVFFDDDISEQRLAEIDGILKTHSAISKAVFISADEAWESFKNEYLGEYADGFTENPLEHSENYEIYLKDVSRQKELTDYLRNLDGVRRVNASEVTANMLTGMNSLIAYVSVGIIIILLAVSIFLISNTVMIGISVRREEIAIMKYIGATDFFVRAPFVIEGLIIGAVGALIPLGIIYVLYDKLIAYVLERFSVLTSLLQFLPVQTVYQNLFPACMAVGVGIGFVGSIMTVRKHLRV
ncbi:MAG: permease-like cell division protein FtsX [Lachnospiraceae bacterium]|nr:permease-like cell division protein FtsX [Lachnospiraceae bacterium]